MQWTLVVPFFVVYFSFLKLYPPIQPVTGGWGGNTAHNVNFFCLFFVRVVGIELVYVLLSYKKHK